MLQGYWCSNAKKALPFFSVIPSLRNKWILLRRDFGMGQGGRVMAI
jgi:hypothetical protein